MRCGNDEEGKEADLDQEADNDEVFAIFHTFEAPTALNAAT
jgi:hypothetical protein